MNQNLEVDATFYHFYIPNAHVPPLYIIFIVRISDLNKCVNCLPPNEIIESATVSFLTITLIVTNLKPCNSL